MIDNKATSPPEMYITLRPTTYGNPKPTGLVTVFWVYGNSEQWDYIYFYDHKPKGTYDPDYVTYCAVWKNSNTDPDQDCWYVSSWEVEINPPPEIWVSYIRYSNGAYRALSNRPFILPQDWMATCMQQFRAGVSDFGRLTLREVFLPGTHNAGSYHFRNVLSEERNILSCQSVDIGTQLLHGARCLDIRLGQFEDKGPFILCHGKYKAEVPLYDLMDQVLSFLQANTEEVVVLVFHRFPVGNWTASLHASVIDYIASRVQHCGFPLGLLPSRNCETVQMESIITSGNRLVLSYRGARQAAVNNQLACPPPIAYRWKDTNSIKPLLGGIAYWRDRENGVNQWLWLAGLTLITQKNVSAARWYPSSLTIDSIGYLNRWLRLYGQYMNGVTLDFFQMSVAGQWARQINDHKVARSSTPNP